MNTNFKNYMDSLTPAKRRMAEETMQAYFACEQMEVEKLDTATKIYKYCKDLANEEVEHSVILLLNQRYKIIKRVNLSKGGLTETAFDVRLAFKEALLNNATIMVMIHNHPSGDPRPSREDDRLTSTFSEAGRIMRIFLADHVIIGDGEYYSYRDAGKL